MPVRKTCCSLESIWKSLDLLKNVTCQVATSNILPININEYCSFSVDTDKLIDYITENRPVSEGYVTFVRERMELNDGEYPHDEVRKNDEFKESKYNAQYLQIAKSYPIYENILKREKAIDFAHLQKDALEIVKKDGFKTQFSNILIDEFQDTDPMQMEL